MDVFHLVVARHVFHCYPVLLGRSLKPVFCCQAKVAYVKPVCIWCYHQQGISYEIGSRFARSSLVKGYLGRCLAVKKDAQ